MWHASYIYILMQYILDMWYCHKDMLLIFWQWFVMLKDVGSRPWWIVATTRTHGPCTSHGFQLHGGWLGSGVSRPLPSPDWWIERIEKKHTCKSVMPCEDSRRPRSFRVDPHSQPFASICYHLLLHTAVVFLDTCVYCVSLRCQGDMSIQPSLAWGRWIQLEWTMLTFRAPTFYPTICSKDVFPCVLNVFLMSWCFCATDYLPMRVQNRPWWFQVQQQVREENNCNYQILKSPNLQGAKATFKASSFCILRFFSLENPVGSKDSGSSENPAEA